MKEWYPFINLYIATTIPSKFQSLLSKETKYIKLHSKTNYKLECRRLQKFFINKNLQKKFNLYLITPFILSKFDINYSDIQQIFPFSNKDNTFFFSEYNVGKRVKIDFKTGFGPHNLGILLTNPQKWKREKLNKFLKSKNLVYKKFAFVWASSDFVGMTRSIQCVTRFIEMVAIINKHLNNLQILVPEWYEKELGWFPKLLDYVYHNKIIIITKNETNIFYPKYSKINKTLTIRLDIFPIPHCEIEQLIMSSIDQILITGDQSLTDVISCCGTNKDIYYQIASEWKQDLVKELGKELPHLKSKPTACFKFPVKKLSKEFIKQNDFRIKGKLKLDMIINQHKSLSQTNFETLHIKQLKINSSPFNLNVIQS